jgi:glycerol-3-phosphate responsive antiterminator
VHLLPGIVFITSAAIDTTATAAPKIAPDSTAAMPQQMPYITKITKLQKKSITKIAAAVGIIAFGSDDAPDAINAVAAAAASFSKAVIAATAVASA